MRDFTLSFVSAGILIAGAIGVGAADQRANFAGSDVFTLESRSDDVLLWAATQSEAAARAQAGQGTRTEIRGEVLRITGPTNRAALDFALRFPNSAGIPDSLYAGIDLRNPGPGEVTVVARVEDPEYAGWHHYSEGVMRLDSGQSGTMLVFLKRKQEPPPEVRAMYPGMHGLPGGYMPIWSGMDPARISKIQFVVESAQPGPVLEVSQVRGVGRLHWPKEASGHTNFFPLLDRYGQYRQTEWPGKIHADDDLVKAREREAQAHRASPGAESWDRFGGWKNGPQLKATGRFRVEKLEGRWWLVDPDGRLFWSHGVTGVDTQSPTPWIERPHFFREIPAGTTNVNVDFYAANLKRKYGAGGAGQALALAHERLRQWGLNTMAAWSDPGATAQKKTPYVRALHLAGPQLAPRLRVPDVFDPAFRPGVRRQLEEEKKDTGGDPWCIGYFPANELEWQNGPEMVSEVLTAAAKRPGKIVLVEKLKKHFPDLQALNSSWGTAYKDWKDLLTSTNKVDWQKGGKAFEEFNEEVAELYFRITDEEMERVLPGSLNLGTRFHTGNPAAIRAAARHCDVVSFNKYATSVKGLRLPEGIDRPILVGEFHFPAWDRSFTADGERSRLGLKQRADAYAYYVEGALANPQIVGVHWFQYLDQPVTGRSDGENWPVGFVDVTDTPYWELAAAARQLGDHLYELRSSGR